MTVRDERRAVLLLALLAVAGGLVRLVLEPRGPPGSAVVAPHLPGGDLVAQAARSRRSEALARPLEPGERVDVDRADAEELERLPRVGPQLARRIVEDRRRRGAYGTLSALDRVPGIGPGLLAALEAAVSFSGAAGPPAPSGDGPGVERAVPEAVPAGACAPGERVRLNQADAERLACLPGVGPALAGRIAADRAARGRYARVEDLARVRGIGPRLVERLRPLVLVP